MTKHSNLKLTRWLLLALFGLSNGWFILLEQLNQVPKYWMHARLDDFIPFLPVFVIPYCVWYLYIALPLAWSFFKRPSEACRLLLFLSSSMFICCCIFTLLPNGQQMRPDTLGEGPLNALVGLLYTIDTPTNSAPSLHVMHSLGCHGILVRLSAGTRHARRVETGSFITLVLIIASTVFIKQHSIIDVVVGLLVGLPLYYGFYGRASLARALAPASAAEAPAFEHKG